MKAEGSEGADEVSSFGGGRKRKKRKGKWFGYCELTRDPSWVGVGTRVRCGGVGVWALLDDHARRGQTTCSCRGGLLNPHSH